MNDLNDTHGCNCPGNGKSEKRLHAPNCPYRDSSSEPDNSRLLVSKKSQLAEDGANAGAANDSLWINGVGRDAEYARCLIVYFNREPTDDELRRFHGAARESMKPAAVDGGVASEDYRQGWMDGANEASRLLATDDGAVLGTDITSIDEMCAILRQQKIESCERTDCTILYTVTFEQLRALYERGRTCGVTEACHQSKSRQVMPNPSNAND